MRIWKEVVVAGAGIVILADPAWAHPGPAGHLHAEIVLPALALVAMVILLARRSPRSGRESGR